MAVRDGTQGHVTMLYNMNVYDLMFLMILRQCAVLTSDNALSRALVRCTRLVGSVCRTSTFNSPESVHNDHSGMNIQGISSPESFVCSFSVTSGSV
jgi:hypothetical protein